MRLSSVFAFGFAATAVTAYTPVSEQFDVRSYEDILGDFSSLLDSQFEKRDAEAQLESLLTTVNQSGLIFTLLDQVANDSATLNLVAQTVGGIISGNTSANSLLSGLNITLNVSSILEAALQSGLIGSTLAGLLLDEDNRNLITDFLGLFLARNTWAGQLLINLGNGDPLSIENIIFLIKTVRSKAGNAQANGVRNVVIDAHNKRDDEFAGSANTFFSNAINAVISSQLLGTSVTTIFQALNNTGILVPIIVQATKDPNTLKLAQTFAIDLYQTGALTDKNLPLNPIFQGLKKDNTLSNSVQTALTHPIFSPALAAIFQRLENSGVYQQVQRNIHGDKPGVNYKSPF